VGSRTKVKTLEGESKNEVQWNPNVTNPFITKSSVWKMVLSASPKLQQTWNESNRTQMKYDISRYHRNQVVMDTIQKPKLKNYSVIKNECFHAREWSWKRNRQITRRVGWKPCICLIVQIWRLNQILKIFGSSSGCRCFLNCFPL